MALIYVPFKNSWFSAMNNESGYVNKTLFIVKDVFESLFSRFIKENPFDNNHL